MRIISMKGYSNLLFVILFSLTTLSFANNTAPVVMTAKSLHWQKVPADPNLQYSLLSGNPNKNGLFTIRLRLPKNYTDIQHTHRATQYDTIISGSYYLTHGNRSDKSSATKLVAGTFIVIPANLRHRGWTNEDTVMQITSTGPWQGLKTKPHHR